MLKELSESLVNTITKMISCSTSTKKFKSLLDKGGVFLEVDLTKTLDTVKPQKSNV